MATLTVVEILAYALASALFCAYLIAPRAVTARLARWALGLALLAQLADIGARCFMRQNPVSSTPEAAAFVGFLISASFFLASTRYRLTAAGAFAVPATLVLIVLARVVPLENGVPRMGALGRAHVLLATGGLAAFAMAAVLAVLYLVEERRLKRKRFDQLRREAPLATLDRLALRCVSFGFPVFTVALVTGAVWVARLGGVFAPEARRPEYLFALAAWLAFGVLLVARLGAGWHGRRAAWLTLLGFSGAMIVLFGYILRYAV